MEPELDTIYRSPVDRKYSGSMVAVTFFQTQRPVDSYCRRLPRMRLGRGNSYNIAHIGDTVDQMAKAGSFDTIVITYKNQWFLHC